MRVLVCGGRDYQDYPTVSARLSALLDECGAIDLLIHGGARGADTLAGRYAETIGIPVTVFPANWSTHGRAAGYIRNKQMLVEGKPDLVVAFPGGRGTANMINQARNAGVHVIEVAK